MSIGFFDSGIGGLTVLHEALKILPHEDYLFYADTMNVPYGEKSREEVRQYIFKSVDFMADQGIKALVIACNTATSIAVEDLRQTYDFPIIGIEPAVKPAVQNCRNKRKKVLVMATHLTLKEDKFHHLVKTSGYTSLVESLPLPGLVELAENGKFSEEKVIAYLTEALTSFDLEQYGTVVLGCTHFPYFADSIKQLFPEDTDIISGNEGTVKNLKRILQGNNLITEGTGSISFFKSGYRVEEAETLANYHKLLRRLDMIQGTINQ